MKHTIVLHEGRGRLELSAEDGLTIHEALIAAGVKAVEAPCNGKGLCGKCRMVARGALSPASAAETRLLSSAEMSAGLRLACMAKIHGDVELDRPEAGAAAIQSDGLFNTVRPDPPVRAVSLSLPEPSLENQADDEQRLLTALSAILPVGVRPARVEFSALPSLAIAARSAATLTAIVGGGSVLAVESGGAAHGWYGVGIDIGTTTIVCYLVDLSTGERISHRAEINEQRAFGADVISRIAATMEQPAALADLRSRVATQLGGMIGALASGSDVAIGDILSVAVAGNTTMMHLLAGVPPAAMAAAPFIPAFTLSRSCTPAELGLELGAATRIFLLPSVSAYVGADIVAGILATGMAGRGNFELLLDIGTNGEIALGGSGGIFCCATAAGPAFEGAGIEKGMGGVEGAIDSVWLDGDSLGFTTIGGKPARGICGSGIIDAIAAFLDCGLLEDSGRILDADEAASLPPGIAALRTDTPKGPVIYLDRGRDIYLSQADMREAQLAKAAIAAGIDVLVARAGKSLQQVEKVFLAGGFGSFLDERNAVRIGLIPRELADRIIVAGNTSGAGALAACLSIERLAACDAITSLCAYVELSSSADFNDAYIERMMFPEMT
jgi:uncharacterized 2Fe-2S/4Fe-4S cluster protein (DUF4445 family)